jgi:hypothetical protein
VALAEKYTQLRILHVGRSESELVQIEIGTNIEQLWTPLNNGIRRIANFFTTREVKWRLINFSSMYIMLVFITFII